MDCALSPTSASCWQTEITHWSMGNTTFQGEWWMTHRQTERTEPQGCSQQQSRGTAAIVFASRSMRRQARNRRSGSVTRDEHATRLCKTVNWSGTMRLPPLQPLHPLDYLPPLLRDSTPHHPKFSSSTCGMTLFKAAKIPPLHNDFKLNYSIHNEKIYTSPLSKFFEIV